MSLADVTAGLAGELADLRRAHAALEVALARASGQLRERDRHIAALTAQCDATAAALAAADGRAAAAESARAGMETELLAARSRAAALRAERDEAHGLARELSEQLGLAEAGLGRRWWRPPVAPQPLPAADPAPILAVAVGLPRAALVPIVRMVRAQAAQAPLLLLVDHPLVGSLDPAPAHWLRLPSQPMLRRHVPIAPEDYLRRRVALLVQALRPATVVPLGAFAGRLLEAR